MKLISIQIRSLFVKLNVIFPLLIMSLLSTNLQSASSCQLVINQPVKLKTKLAPITLKTINRDSITTQLPSSGLTNLDELYGLSKDNKTWFFRLSRIEPSPAGNQLYFLKWANNRLPPIGTYELATYEEPPKSSFKRTLDTIGDSITWGGNGQFLRCLLRDQGFSYDFRGSHVDSLGFEHDGEGGDTTQTVLARIHKIPIADAYFLLIGTNDQVPPQEVVNNITQIGKQLYAKNNSATIYISTLLPRADGHFERNQIINQLLLQTHAICPRCKIIDVGGAFYALKNWQKYFPDKLHPNYEGYVELAKIISHLINNDNNTKG